MWWPFGIHHGLIWWHGGIGWGVVAGIIALIFWVGFIALVAWGIMKLARKSGANRFDPLAIAKERYARGEISKEEFDEIKKNLS